MPNLNTKVGASSQAPRMRDETPIKTRFAPSPTGLMHFGNLRVALFNLLYTKKYKGLFLLRIEDTDVARSELHYRDAILQDLNWMKIAYDEGPFYQSERKDEYDNYYQRLIEQGLLYPCFCSEEQLAITRKIQLNAGQPPRYAGTCRNLSVEEIAAKKAQGIPYTLRFQVPKGQSIDFEDLIKGPQRYETDHIGDFIVCRGDKSASFMFCNAIDDALMGVTHALRGDDHLTNTPRQIMILKALDLPIPCYGHFPTILGPDGRRLSKRNGSRSIQELQEDGYLPKAIYNYLARLGHYDPDPKLLDLETLAETFELGRISGGPAHFDEAQLNHWQKEAMHHCSSEECWKLIAPFVADNVPTEKQEEFVAAVQPNLVKPKDAKIWAHAIFDEILDYSDVKSVLIEAGPDFFILAAEILKEGAKTFQELLKQLQEKTGLKGKALFFPLRGALTATLHGPELALVLNLMGSAKARHRFLEAAHRVTGAER